MPAISRSPSLSSSSSSSPSSSPSSSSSSPHSDTRFDETFLRKLEALTLLAKRVQRGDARGERRSRRIGAGIEFADHRDYAPGDDVRMLDWGLYARLDRPFVRLREEEEDLLLQVVVDGSSSMALGTPPKLELALRIGAALAYVGLVGLDRVGVSVVGAGVREAMPPTRGRGGALRLLDLLGRVGAAGRTDLAAAVREVLAAAGTPRRALTVLVSDFFDAAGWRPVLDRLRFARHEVVVVQVTAAEDAQTTLDGEVTVEDVETGEARELLVTAAARRAYAERYAAWLRGVAATCRERGILCFQIGSDVPFEDAVLRILRAGGVLA
jgi:uncharacterized protein (DUF58 family)